MESRGRGGGFLIWFLVTLVLMFLLFTLRSGSEEISFFELKQLVEARQAKKALIGESTVTIVVGIDRASQDSSSVGSRQLYATVTDKNRFTEIANLFEKHGVSYKYVQDSNWLGMLLTYVPFFLILLIWFYFIRSMNPGGGKNGLSITKAPVSLPDEKNKKTFRDVAGIDEAKAELEEIVDFLKNPEKFMRLGAKMPRGVLLVGPPGCGKTLLARAVAGEADAGFLSMSGSGFVELFVGIGAARVRDLFKKAQSVAPCIVFVDELDAVGRHRGSGLGGGHDEREQTLNQLLVEMDGFTANAGIIVIAATNRPDILDPALLRPGRFDRKVFVHLPDIKGRHEILKVHTQNISLDPNTDLFKIAKGTSMFSGADLANLVNEAALAGAKKNKMAVDLEDFEEARDKILAGKERKLVLDDKTKREIAYHEVGHTLVALSMPDVDPVYRVSIIPRGMSLGHTQQLPEKDRYLYDKHRIIAEITCLLGGRAAERAVLNIETTGAENDLKRATELARKMVYSWGMSEGVGLMQLDSSNGEFFLGQSLLQHKSHSEATAAVADKEMQKILTDCFDAAVKILNEKRDVLEKLVRALLEKETLSRDDIDAILQT